MILTSIRNHIPTKYAVNTSDVLPGASDQPKSALLPLHGYRIGRGSKINE